MDVYSDIYPEQIYWERSLDKKMKNFQLLKFQLSLNIEPIPNIRT